MGTPAGGAYSTVDDLFKFSQALYSMKLLSLSSTKEILSSSIEHPSKDIFTENFKIANIIIPENFSPYGFAGAWNKFGFAVWDNPSLIGHTGGTSGANALFIMSPDNKYTIIILSNIDMGTLKLYQSIRNILKFNGQIRNF